VILSVVSSGNNAGAAEPTTVRLWEGDAPGAQGNAENDIPTLTVHLPEKDVATGAAVVICPGGGYRALAIEYEGHDVAKWLNTLGVAGIVLKYRHRGTGYGHPAPLRDVQRAIRLVRANAEKWHVDRKRVGVLGFSAGGHLASSAGTHFKDDVTERQDDTDDQPCRPDFMVLIYPVITFEQTIRHDGSMRNLLGEEPDPQLVETFSNEKRVTPETPPTFIIHGTNDRSVPVENAILLYETLHKAGVPVEMHLYRDGPHGFGLGNRKGNKAESWPKLCADWMQASGLLKDSARQE
jgi:acetyl esterase/lipase